MTPLFNMDVPLRVGADGRLGGALYAKHVRNMIKAFLFTNAGERVMRPEFGSGLLQLPFAPNSPELAAALQLSGRAGLERWLGDIIEVRAFEAIADEAALTVKVNYALRLTGEARTDEFVREMR
jgi:phage baseplate assembly protein W